MTIAQIAKLFRQFVDEPNKTFLTDDDVRLYLQIAYDQFREIAFQIDPKVFTETLANLPITTQNIIDLTQSPIVAGGSNSILGNLAYASGRTMLDRKSTRLNSSH